MFLVFLHFPSIFGGERERERERKKERKRERIKARCFGSGRCRGAAGGRKSLATMIPGGAGVEFIG